MSVLRAPRSVFARVLQRTAQPLPAIFLALATARHLHRHAAQGQLSRRELSGEHRALARAPAVEPHPGNNRPRPAGPRAGGQIRHELPTSIDNMQWSNKGLQTLWASPNRARGARSLDHPREGRRAGGGGQRRRRHLPERAHRRRRLRAHRPGSHSTQASQATIEEVRRILYEQLGERAK